MPSRPTGTATASTRRRCRSTPRADAIHALTLLQPVGYERPMPVADGIEVEFINAGHLLGSAYARVRTGGQTILFGGDLGRFGRPVLPDPTMVEQADYLLVESTYGNRVHERRRRRREAGAGDPRDRGARRQADHSGVRGRPRRGAALLDQEARGREADPGAAGVRRQPDGAARRSRATPSASTSSIPICSPDDTDEKAPHGPAAHEDSRTPPPPGAAGARAVRVLHAEVPRRSRRRRNRRS